jgi:N-acetylmuramoyl-L-alanine amidase
MKILRHRLHQDDDTALPFERSPNTGGAVEHEYLVMHFTAAPSAESSVNWLTNPDANASAHVVIGRDGSITQLVPFDRVAWHAGISAWEGREGLNQCSLGIELDNAGPLKRVNGRWQAWFGTTYPDEEVLEAVHKNESTPRGWHLFTPEQLEAAIEVATLLVNKYDLLDVVGHDDIAPHRKVDPGPAFPMRSFRARVMGRAADVPPVHATTTHLNIRTGPGTRHEKLEGSPLPPETRVEVLDTQAEWRFVDVLDEVDDVMDLQGWVHGRYLRRLDEQG